MALALLKRSDTDLILPVACDAPEKLAAELSALQPFTVEVVAAWAGCAGKLPMIQNALWSRLVKNSWFSVTAEEVKQLMSKACKQEEDVRTLETSDAQLLSTLGSERCENDLIQNVTASACEPPRPRVWVDPMWHAYLEECPRATADKATAIRKALKKALGPLEAAALLSRYKECALRVATGGCQRFIVNERGATMKLAQKTVAI
jgi:hypothetical protein